MIYDWGSSTGIPRLPRALVGYGKTSSEARSYFFGWIGQVSRVCVRGLPGNTAHCSGCCTRPPRASLPSGREAAYCRADVSISLAGKTPGCVEYSFPIIISEKDSLQLHQPYRVMPNRMLPQKPAAKWGFILILMISVIEPSLSVIGGISSLIMPTYVYSLFQMPLWSRTYSCICLSFLVPGYITHLGGYHQLWLHPSARAYAYMWFRGWNVHVGLYM